MNQWINESIKLSIKKKAKISVTAPNSCFQTLLFLERLSRSLTYISMATNIRLFICFQSPLNTPHAGLKEMPKFTTTYLSTVWIAAVELYIRKSIHVKVTVTYETVSSQAGFALSRQRFIMEWQITTRVNCLGELKTNSGHNKTGAKTLAI